ncbi:outer membrane beta-barrel protein [Flavitalea flava]
MKKCLLILAIAAGTTFSTQAQINKEGFTFGAGVNVALPIGSFHDSHTFGIGGELQGEYMFSENLSAVATTGYTSYFGKSQTIDFGAGPITAKNPSVGLIPILVGARFYPSEQFFVGAQIGYGIFTGGGGGAPKGFEYRPQVGFNAESFQLILHYDGVSVTGGTLSHLGLTGIYKFGGN